MGSYSTLDDFDRRTRSGIEDTLFHGEEFLGANDAYDAWRRSRRTKLILTDQRLITFKRGLIRQSITDYDRDRISNVSFDKGLIFRKLSVNGSGFDEKWYVDYADGQPFAAAIRNQAADAIFTPSSDALPAHAEPMGDTTAETDAAGSPGATPPSTSEPEPYLTNPNAEVYGFDKWHYAALGAAVIGYLGVGAGISGVTTISLLAAGVSLYLDSQYMQEASTWRPKTWLYLVGLLFAFLSLPVYLYHRHQVVSRTDTDVTADAHRPT